MVAPPSWVGYSQPGFEGRQHVLEEGEYLDWDDWGGGSERFLSLRPVQTVSPTPEPQAHLSAWRSLD